MSIYRNDWRDKPEGYYADPGIKARHDRRVREERKFNRLVEIELGKMGYDRDEIPTQEDVERAEEIARNKF
ncbi:hypothetical protein HRTV-25_gp104 [Halorubrum tailed virus 25]|uniref:Uncharacterized protein n=1 Tax=Halorubrum tailed virus 25 TaxID=2878006 RepID=A0AAE8XYA5_9CAUD|nr:hypothetical protein M1M37_gp104 [Halorubrum tailed virus 25]UBF22685.1 hypothetical protein HRTV-25_gp104 [Halorubrum tailed virus 25]